MDRAQDEITFWKRKEAFGLSVLPDNNLRQLGILYCGKVAAEYFKANYNKPITHVLFRANAHTVTYSDDSTFKKDDLHLTFDLKTEEMVQTAKHYTVHVNITENVIVRGENIGIKGMFDVVSVKPKLHTTELAEENDNHHSEEKNTDVNNWAPGSLLSIPAPPELREMKNNETFLEVADKVLNRLKDDWAVVAKATPEETTSRSATRVEEAKKLEAQAKKKAAEEAKKKADEDALKKEADEAKNRAGATQGAVPKK